MNAYKCDRCGKLYEKKQYNRRICVTDTPCSTVGLKDLCKDCQNELEKWFYRESEVKNEK